MDMQLDQDIIRSHREARAWSQNHLAEVAGLSLRTVQRIEKSGQASMESARALSAVLEIPLDGLRQTILPSLPKSNLNAPKNNPGKILILTVPAIVTLVTAVWFSAATAEPAVMVDLSVSSHGAVVADAHMLNKQGVASEMMITGLLKISVTSEIIAQDVMLSVKIYEQKGETLSLTATPKLLVGNKQPAAIKFDTESGDHYEFVFTPNI